MLIRRSRPGDSAAIRPSEITPESVYLNRRRLLQAALAAGVAGLGGMGGAQPLAVTMNGGVALVIEVDPSRIEKRLSTKYLDESTAERAGSVT